VSVEKAQAEMTTIGEAAPKEYPRSNDRIGAVVVPVLEQVTAPPEPLSGFCSPRRLCPADRLRQCSESSAGESRRTPAGDGRPAGSRSRSRRLIRQMITESVLLSLLGGGLGIALAAFSLMRAGKSLVPPWMTASATVSIDTTVLLFALGLSVATGLLFGAAPAVLARRTMHDLLKQGGRGGVAPNSNPVRR